MPGTYDEATDTSGAPTETTIPGTGMFVRADPQQYTAEELNISADPCLLFAPNTYPLKAYTPDFVLPGDQVTLNGLDWAVKKILSVVAPDGFVIIARIAVGAA